MKDVTLLEPEEKKHYELLIELEKAVYNKMFFDDLFKPNSDRCSSKFGESYDKPCNHLRGDHSLNFDDGYTGIQCNECKHWCAWIHSIEEKVRELFSYDTLYGEKSSTRDVPIRAFIMKHSVEELLK